jgi:hypothetical protein
MFLLLGGFSIRPPSDTGGKVHHNKTNVARPLVKALYNIFHPYDPVAHRLEPLFSHRMATLKPIPIHYSKGGITQTVKGIEAARSEMVERGRSLLSGLVISAGSMLTKISGSQTNSEMELTTIDRLSSVSNVSMEGNIGNVGAKSPERRRSSLGNPKSPERKSTTNPASKKPSSRSEPSAAQQSIILKMKALNDHGRLDFALQESLLENPYLSSLGSHMSYWTDLDANSLIIRSLYHIQLSSSSTLA